MVYDRTKEVAIADGEVDGIAVPGYTDGITRHYGTTGWRRKCSFDRSNEKSKRRRSKTTQYAI
jgi:hypothetical protein